MKAETFFCLLYLELIPAQSRNSVNPGWMNPVRCREEHSGWVLQDAVSCSSCWDLRNEQKGHKAYGRANPAVLSSSSLIPTMNGSAVLFYFLKRMR